MNLNKPKNENYAATVVDLKDFVDLPNCDNVKAALIYGNSVIVAKTAQAGEQGLFFPVETQLSTIFLGSNNLFRHHEWGNIDSTKTGFFEQHGRVKAVRFRGHKSEGFWIPINSLSFIPGIKINDFNVGDTFDEIDNIPICTKYISKDGPVGEPNSKRSSQTTHIVEGQFRFHYDTSNLKKNIYKLQPTDIISISDKWHGTSAIIGKVLVGRELSWLERLLTKFGIKIQTTEYATICSSRRVIKGIGKFNSDLYGTVAKEVEDKILKGYTLYGEIVGYKPDGSHIQKGTKGKVYHYGCEKGEHKFVVYRIVSTNVDGKTLELTWLQMKEFCNKYGLEMVKELYYGTVLEFLKTYDPDGYFCQKYLGPNQQETWHQYLLEVIQTTFVNDQMCPHNNNELPAEGVVVRIDHLDECESWKLKNFAFLELETKMNDAGEVDIETQESEN